MLFLLSDFKKMNKIDTLCFPEQLVHGQDRQPVLLVVVLGNVDADNSQVGRTYKIFFKGEESSSN